VKPEPKAAPGAAAPTPGRRATAPGLVALAACVALEGLALVTVGAVVLVDLLRDGAGKQVLFVFLVALFALYGGVLLAAARAVLRRRRWARAPAVLSSLLALPVGWDATGQDQALIGVPVLAVGLAGLVLAMLPAAGGLLVAERGGAAPGDAGA